jgi:hypothetical protein
MSAPSIRARLAQRGFDGVTLLVLPAALLVLLVFFLQRMRRTEESPLAPAAA